MRSSLHYFILFTIFFSSLSINPSANSVGSHLITVPLPVFKKSVEKTIEVVQNVASTMPHMHVDDDNGNSKFTVSYCVDLLGTTAQVLNCSLSTIHDLKDDVISHMRTWLNTSLGSQKACMEAFDFPNSMTTSIHELLSMLDAQKQQKQQLIRGKFELSQLTPNVTVSQDGSAYFKRIMDAVRAAPNDCQNDDQFVIFVKKGVYKEYVNIEATKCNLVLIGEGMDVTTISGDRSNHTGYPIFNSATFGVRGKGFVAMNMGFENTAGARNMQAVAVASGGDKSVFYRCKMSGYQDTLYVFSGRQFYRECNIRGTIDFIFGYGTAVFQNCTILARKGIPGTQNVLTAHGRKTQDSSGFSFQFCTIAPDSDLATNVSSTPTYLGRPWEKYSRTVFMQSSITNVIRPQGWLQYNGTLGLDTLYYGEYFNTGPGAVVSGRVKWPGYHVITDPCVADEFTVAKFIDGNSWLPALGIPYAQGLKDA